MTSKAAMPLRARWQALAGRFAALNQRERVMVAVAAVVGMAMIGHTFWVDPARVRVAALQRQISQQQTDTVLLRAQLVALQAPPTDPDAARKQALAEVDARLAALDQERQHFDNILVPPQRVPQLLRGVLARHRGLELVGLQTLEPTPLIERRKDLDGKPAADTAGPASGGNIFKHGIEIKVAGSYADLVAYLAELEHLPQKLLLGSMSLTVKEYPRSELTLVVYSLSLDWTWLVV
jgi:MSHA biogenesis protein MshJ